MHAIDDGVGVKVIVAAEDEVDSRVAGDAEILGEFVVVGLALVRDGDDDVGALGAELRDELLRDGAGGQVDEVGREGVDGGEPFALAEADEADLEAGRGGQEVGARGVAEGDVGAEGRVEDVGEEPGEVALGGEVAELLDAKVEVVVLGGLVSWW